jgi:hypothetical protein
MSGLGVGITMGLRGMNGAAGKEAKQKMHQASWALDSDHAECVGATAKCFECCCGIK